MTQHHFHYYSASSTSSSSSLFIIITNVLYPVWRNHCLKVHRGGCCNWLRHDIKSDTWTDIPEERRKVWLKKIFDLQLVPSLLSRVPLIELYSSLLWPCQYVFERLWRWKPNDTNCIWLWYLTVPFLSPTSQPVTLSELQKLPPYIWSSPLLIYFVSVELA